MGNSRGGGGDVVGGKCRGGKCRGGKPGESVVSPNLVIAHFFGYFMEIEGLMNKIHERAF